MVIAPRRGSVVVFVHGINDAGRWDALRRVFTPFFHCVQVRYRDFHCRGESKLVLWFWVLLLGPALGLAASGWHATEGLACAVLLAGGTAGWYEYDWDGGRRGLAALAGLTALSLLVVGSAWLSGGAYRDAILWAALVGFVAFFDWREQAWPSAVAAPGRPALLLLAGAAAWWLVRAQGWAGFAGACGLLAAWGLVDPYVRRRRAAAKVYRQLAGACASDPEPHLIGHSLGTFLTGTVLRHFPPVRLGRVVFIGSVLSNRFDWEGLLKPDRGAADEVRNEQGCSDLVVWLANGLGWLGWVGTAPAGGSVMAWRLRWVGLGDAGRVGFRGPGVHTLHSHYGRCPACEAGPPCRVHNVVLPRYAHSTAFLHPLHAREFWLPYLWGVEPRELHDFLALCAKTAAALGRGDADDFQRQAGRLARRRWRWTRRRGPGLTLRETLRQSFPLVLRDLLGRKEARERVLPPPAYLEEAVYRKLPRLLAVEAADAYREMGRPEAYERPEDPDPRDHALLQSLYPPMAIRRATTAALRQVLG